MCSTAQSGRLDYTILHQWRDEGNMREFFFVFLCFCRESPVCCDSLECVGSLIVI